MDNNEKILPIKDKHICLKCLKKFEEKDLHKISIGELGYGSMFDGMSTELELCENCYNESDPTIWNMSIEKRYASEYGYELFQGKDYVVYEQYVHEDKMFEYLESLPIQSQELIFNTNADGWNCGIKLDPQDWIDYNLGILSHSKCKEYGLYSCDEIRVYKERFPTCQHPKNVLYKDGSVGCWCRYGAHGEANQIPSINISDECYTCQHYEKRKTEIETVMSEQ